MISVQEADAWIGRTAVDDTGEQIGLISQIWVDDVSGQPEWASVKIAGREALVPLAGASALGGGSQFAFSKSQIRSAPRVAQDGHLEVDDKERVASHYGVPVTEAVAPAPTAPWSEHGDQTEPTAASEPASSLEAEPAPVAEKANRRFRRKPASVGKPATGRSAREAASDQPATDAEVHPDEVPLAG